MLMSKLTVLPFIGNAYSANIHIFLPAIYAWSALTQQGSYITIVIMKPT